MPVVILLVCETIINIVWLVASPLDYHEFADPSSDVLTYHACGGQHATAFVSASVAFNGLIALWGVWLALQIRHVPEAFSESKLMGASLYNLALVMAITIPLTWTASNTQSSHEDLIIPGAAILWCSFVTIALVVTPKLYYIVYPPPQHFFDGYPTDNVTMKAGGKGDRRGSNAEKEGSDESDRPAGNIAASPAATTVHSATWSPANGKLPSSSSSSLALVKDHVGRNSSFQPSSKRLSHSTGLTASTLGSLTSLDSTSLQQMSPANSSAVLDRQLSSGSTASLHQVQIDIQSPQPLSSPANRLIRLMSHERQHIGMPIVCDVVDSPAEVKRASRVEAVPHDSFSPPPAKRSTIGRTVQPPPPHSTQLEAGRRSYAASPAVQYSQSSVSSPYLNSSPQLYPITTSSPTSMRTSLSVDDLDYLPARSTFHLPPIPQLTQSASHTGSPVHSSLSRGAGNVVRVLSANHRMSNSGQQPSQPSVFAATAPTALD